MRSTLTTLALLSLTVIAVAQNQPVAFEAASIRPHQGLMPRIGVSMAGKTLTAEAMTTFGLIMEAYDLKGYQIVLGTPDLPVRDTPYDVIAKSDGVVAPSKAEFRQMLQGLLLDRFKLKVHHEMRELPVYALVVGKNGFKLKEAAEDSDIQGYLRVVGRNYEITQLRATIDDIAQWIMTSAFLDRPVVNHTALIGLYDFRLNYTPNLRINYPPNLKANQDSDPAPTDVSIFTAVDEQLGLKLEATKAVVEVLVIDHAEKPDAN